jgi:single-strand DNA-binding protein
MRVAVNESVKGPDGNWSERPSYFNVDVFGGQAESCAQYLTKGRQIAVSGRLRWREWETQEGQKREAVSIVADRIQFIGPRAETAGAPAAATTHLLPEDDDQDIPF